MLQIPTWQRVMIWLTVAIGLLFAMPNAFYDRVEKHNDAAVFLETGIGNASMRTEEQRTSDLAGWPGWLPSSVVNLGLDLRGGAHLLAEVRVEEAYSERMDSYWFTIRENLRDMRSEIGAFRRVVEGPGDQLRILMSDPEGIELAVQAIRGLASPIIDVSGFGSTDIEVSARGDLITVDLSEAGKQATDDITMQQSLEIVRKRVDAAGTREPTIQFQGSGRILIQVPGIGSATELKELIGTTAKLTFHEVIGEPTGNPNENPGAGNILIEDLDNQGLFYRLVRTPLLSGEDLTSVQPDFDQNGSPAVAFTFNPAAARIFADFTRSNIGSPFAIVLDDRVLTAPVIQSPITGGSGIITGNFTVESSNDLAVQLNSGALPAGMDFLEERTIGPELGQDSIDAGTIACIVAFIAVLVFMALSYGLFGIFANIALVINVGLMFAFLSIFNATLTLPGIAGIVLTIGMAVDANVLIFERIREELRSAKSPARAIELGYEKALSAILDANITTFITAVILFAMGSGPVSGFAVTLAVGIVTSVFTAIFLTRAIIVLWFERTRPKEIEV